jgi:hypothetical protein
MASRRPLEAPQAGTARKVLERLLRGPAVALRECSLAIPRFSARVLTLLNFLAGKRLERCWLRRRRQRLGWVLRIVWHLDSQLVQTNDNRLPDDTA